MHGERLKFWKMTKIWGGQPVLASPTANSGGIRPPVIYAHAFMQYNKALSGIYVWSREP